MSRCGVFLRSAHSLPKCTARVRKMYHVPGRTGKIYYDADNVLRCGAHIEIIKPLRPALGLLSAIP